MPTVKNELLQRDIEAYYKSEADIRDGLVEIKPDDASRALIDFALAVREADAKVNDTRFSELLREFGITLRAQKRNALPNGLGNGMIVRAACRAGIIAGLDEQAVGDMQPWQVIQIANEVADAIQTSLEVPKA